MKNQKVRNETFSGDRKVQKTAESVNKLCKYQIFTQERVHRSQLHEAKYNPR